ncbi:MAG: RsmE family RNA methyltransferase [Pelagibacteraceae bacterium]|jgi:16S rRNA (uracil1498-N3)-methyltransferase
MSIIRLYHPENILENSTSLLSKEHTHYLVNVMRAKRGGNVNFFNKNGEWLSEIVFLEKDRVEVKFLSKIKENTNTHNIELAICLVKKNAMEIILQKATELGIKKIIPIISERTEVKEINFERANKIVIEATEQSNQLEPPQISEILNLKDFLNINRNKIFFADINSDYSLEKKDFKEGETVTVLVGPEGDFSPTERELILNGSTTVAFSLSKNILRTDTAVISAISLVNFITNQH